MEGARYFALPPSKTRRGLVVLGIPSTTIESVLATPSSLRAKTRNIVRSALERKRRDPDA